MRTRCFRVWGPHKHGRRWRVRLQRPDGEVIVESLVTEAEATASAEDARKESPAGMTISQLAEQYLGDLRRRGCREATLTNAGEAVGAGTRPHARTSRHNG